MIRTKKRMILCSLLLIAMLSFIWGNSLANGTESGAMSGRIMEWINRDFDMDPKQLASLIFRACNRVAP